MTPSPIWLRLAPWIIVGLLFAGILTDVAIHPNSHTTMPTYRLAATQWWQGIDPYTQRSNDGFLYFPQAALIFSPFNLPGFAGDLLWRAFTFGLFLYALVQLHRAFLADRGTAGTFLILCLLAVPSSLASLRNAQFDLPLAALIVLTTAEAAESRWIAAAFWLCFAIALKPLAAVPLLLFAALYWKLIPRLAVGLIVVALLPFLHWSPAFVAHEYSRCYETLAWATKADAPKYSDLAALVSMKLGYDAPMPLKTALRILFALVYFALGAFAVRRLPRVEAAWTVGALAADYLMLFNPRTETCSYVVLGPFIASLALYYAKRGAARWAVYALGFAALGLACDAFPKLGHFSVHDLTDRWFKPFIALIFLPVIVGFIFRRPPLGTAAATRNLSPKPVV